LRLALDLERRGNLLALMQAQADFLEVEDDVGHVLLDSGQSRKLVEDVFDPDCRNRVAGQRGQQDAPQRVANGDSVAAFERFRGKFAVGRSDFLLVELDSLGFDQISPVILHSLCSFSRWISRARTGPPRTGAPIGVLRPIWSNARRSASR